MSSSKRATIASARNYLDNQGKNNKEFLKQKRAIERKYEDRGSSGEKQMQKELHALYKEYDKIDDKRYKKGHQDDANVAKYGKDAMKGKSFASYSKGGMAKKGFYKGGLCGASNTAARPIKKSK